MPETLAALFLAHVLADYVFQSAAMVDTKSKPETLFLHFLIVLLTAMATTGHVASPAIYALALIHVAIDAIKVKAFSDKFLPHIADQVLHLLTLAIFAKAAPNIYTTGTYGDISWLPKLMLYAAGLIYVTRAGGFAVGKLMAGFGDNPIEESLDKGGFWIGLLERGLIYLLLIGDMAGGIGFLVAAMCNKFIIANRNLWFVAAGACAFMAALLLLSWVFQLMPIAGARTVFGLACQALAGAIGGYVFSKFTASIHSKG